MTSIGRARFLKSCHELIRSLGPKMLKQVQHDGVFERVGFGV